MILQQEPSQPETQGSYILVSAVYEAEGVFNF